MKPAVKVLDTTTDVVMFTPGGGGSLPSTPDTPGVNNAPAMEEPDDMTISYHYSVWDEELSDFGR